MKRLSDFRTRRDLDGVTGTVRSFTQRNPIVVALTLALLVTSVPVTLLIAKQQGFDETQTEIAQADHDSRQRSIQTLVSLVKAQVHNCDADRRFRLQYRDRGIAEKALLSLFLGLARKSVAEKKPGDQVSKDFLKQFSPLYENIEIIPPPDCQEAGRRMLTDMPPGTRKALLADRSVSRLLFGSED